MLSLVALAIFCGQLMLAPVQAANVVWNTPQTMTADTNVRTYGSLVGAFNISPTVTTTTVNGVSFAGTLAGSPPTFGSVAALAPVAGTDYLGAASWGPPNSPTLSSNYATLNDSGAFAYGGSGQMTLTLTSLTPGRSYMLQTWVGDTRAAGAARRQTLTGGVLTSGTMLFNSTGADGGNGSFVVGSFVATTDAMTINYNPGADIGMMNAFQLRSLGLSRSYTWTATGATPLADGGGTWNAADTNWASGTAVGTWGDATSDVAVFGVGNGAAGTVTVGSVALNGITFNAAGSGNYTLSSGTLALGGTIPTIQTNAAGTSTIASVISGAAGLIKSGTGTLALTGANTYSGATTIEAGTVRVGHASALGGSSNALNLTGGTLDLDGTSLSVGRLSGLAGTVITTNAAAGTATLSTTVASGSSTFAGTIQDNRAGVVALTKAGAGTLALTGLNSFTGATTVSAGTLLVTGQLGNTGVTVDSGATLGGSGSIAGAVTVNGLFSPGTSPGVISVASLVLGGSSTSVFEIDGLARATQYDGTDVTGALT
ncbi:MAG: beta strand repeat-containing protein [Planctomycetia bacterium]|jgi:fibronectin-binding autotransporter adhesin